MQTRVYYAPGLSAEDLGQRVRQWFVDQDYETQFFETPDGRLLVQGYRDDLWRVAIGFAAAITVHIRPLSDERLEVELGAGAWGDKAITAGLGLLFFLPLVLTAAWGTWQQYQLDKQLWDVIGAALPTGSEVLSDAPTTKVATNPAVPERWFDEASGEIYAVRFVERMESWQRAMADGQIDASEIQAQGDWVTGLLRGIEPSLSPEAHQKLTLALQELAVLQGMQSYALLQHLDPTTPPARADEVG
ncbi:hypothetical protein [Candidatus Cyanaurora vandensis]|uniref:hypothetical protein n=1 Tax=Candidatus Cyanaurora vandensis TaxID=2714958 RepID=UPI00257F550C|nr:hypothetical protein [Candidatus Cyanaurora vandensis]